MPKEQSKSKDRGMRIGVVSIMDCASSIGTTNVWV